MSARLSAQDVRTARGASCAQAAAAVPDPADVHTVERHPVSLEASPALSRKKKEKICHKRCRPSQSLLHLVT